MLRRLSSTDSLCLPVSVFVNELDRFTVATARADCMTLHGWTSSRYFRAAEITVRRAILARCGFFGTPRGLGLATATTSAAFLPHLEQRIRFIAPGAL